MENKPEEMLKNPCEGCFRCIEDVGTCRIYQTYQSDKEAFNKLKAGKALIHDTLEKYRGTALLDQQVIKDLKAEISQLKADKMQMIEELDLTMLCLHDYPDSWQSFKERWLK